MMNTKDIKLQVKLVHDDGENTPTVVDPKWLNERCLLWEVTQRLTDEEDERRAKINEHAQHKMWGPLTEDQRFALRNFLAGILGVQDIDELIKQCPSR